MGSVDRVIVVAVMAGGWWALLLGEVVGTGAHRRELRALNGPDWDVRAPDVAQLRASLGGSLGDSARAVAPEPYPRTLRQGRGIGRRRALDLARYYHLEGPRAPADALYGVGPKTARAAAAAVSRMLSAHRAMGEGR